MDHWVCVTNYNPWFDINKTYDYWWVYDSMNNPLQYLQYIKPIMRKLNNNSDVSVMYPTVVQQKGYF